MPKSQQEFWKKKFDSTLVRDQEKLIQLRQIGWNVLTVWECKINSEPQKVLIDIIQMLKSDANK